MPVDRIPFERMPLLPDGQPVTAEDIRKLRDQIASFDTIEVIAGDTREIVERFMPDPVARLPPMCNAQALIGSR